MNTQTDSITILLANRSYLYRLLQRTFGDEPDFELLKIVTNEHTKESLELLIGEGDHKFDLLNRLEQGLVHNKKITLDKLKGEYTYLMIGPNKLPAPPWESIYRTKERLIFQESTLKVRKAYLEYNFTHAKYPHEPDDHLSLELDFMAHLSQLAAENLSEGKTKEVKKILEDQKAFLDQHLLVWIGEFAEQIQKSKTHYFYPQMALLTEEVLKVDRKLIEEVISVA
ncbi:molecular chaperone TorD family protein [Bacillus sp. B15-48]|uniref:TorD/DmsD family molecular chaperone n=1 Tax=Bacillus sp. B15-48 TaxID=1548601 RepID=UPI00193FCDA9|nr:molecular chaperone TorD family protein [Bacillus sp. B15-48]MBM4765338.1 dehydrogenase [Bacillus sp. B15-48]